MSKDRGRFEYTTVDPGGVRNIHRVTICGLMEGAGVGVMLFLFSLVSRCMMTLSFCCAPLLSHPSEGLRSVIVLPRATASGPVGADGGGGGGRTSASVALGRSLCVQVLRD